MSQVVLDCTKDNSRCPRCPELSLGLLWHMMAIPDNPQRGGLLRRYVPPIFFFWSNVRQIPFNFKKGLLLQEWVCLGY